MQNSNFSKEISKGAFFNQLELNNFDSDPVAELIRQKDKLKKLIKINKENFPKHTEWYFCQLAKKSFFILQI